MLAPMIEVQKCLVLFAIPFYIPFALQEYNNPGLI
jgi:hypothetical protein